MSVSQEMSFNLGDGFSIQFRFRWVGLRKQLECVWEPDLPDAEQFARLLPAYRDARRKYFESLGRGPGLVVAL